MSNQGYLSSNVEKLVRYSLYERLILNEQLGFVGAHSARCSAREDEGFELVHTL
jgi:hypothetical protein